MKLSKLPDRAPVKLSVTLTPSLDARLRNYAEFYTKTYGVREEVADLVPFILTAFLDGDADFRRASRTPGPNELPGGESHGTIGRRVRGGPQPKAG